MRECAACPSGTGTVVPGAAVAGGAAAGAGAGAGAAVLRAGEGATRCELTSCPVGKHLRAVAGMGEECVYCYYGRYGRMGGGGGGGGGGGNGGGSSGSSGGVCLACPAGKHNNDYGRDRCSVCNPNSFAARRGASTCTACPRGKFQPERAAARCEVPGAQVLTYLLTY